MYLSENCINDIIFLVEDYINEKKKDWNQIIKNIQDSTVLAPQEKKEAIEKALKAQRVQEKNQAKYASMSPEERAAYKAKKRLYKQQWRNKRELKKVQQSPINNNTIDANINNTDANINNTDTDTNSLTEALIKSIKNIMFN